MIIKYCPKCSMKPYTTDMAATNCPSCKSPLMIEGVNNENDLIGRPVLSVNQNYNDESDYSDYDDIHARNPFPTQVKLDDTNDLHKKKKNEVIGRVYGYSNSAEEAGRYKRLFVTKIIDALVYGQRTEDVLHRFYVRSEDNTSMQNDIPVIIHGTLSAGSGIMDNSLVRVSGKFHKGVFYARKIKVMNNGYESSVRPQISVSKLLIAIISLLLFISGAALMFFDRAGVNATLLVVKNYLIVFAVVYLALYLISLLLMVRSKFAVTAIAMSGKGMKGIGIINFILAAIISFPIYKLLLSVGFSLTGVFSVFAPIIIMVIGIVLMISCILR